MAVRERYKLQLSARTIRPGDPDFEAVVATLTPPELIQHCSLSDQDLTLYGVMR